MLKQNLDSFAETLKDMGFIQLTAESFNSNLIMGIYDENRLEKIRVSVNPTIPSVTIEAGNQNFIFGTILESIKKIKELTETRVNRDISEEELAAARMIREVKTLKLSSNDRLAIIVKDNGYDREQLQNLHGFVARWLGEKDSRKVLMIMGDIEMVKVRNE